MNDVYHPPLEKPVDTIVRTELGGSALRASTSNADTLDEELKRTLEAIAQLQQGPDPYS